MQKIFSCVSKTTQWEHPKTGKKKTLTGGKYQLRFIFTEIF